LRFWDTSAVIPLISEEATPDVLNDLLREDRETSAWWGTWPECAVAISRFKRESIFDEESEEKARAALDTLAADWTEIEPTDDILLSVSLLSQDHPLKTADMLQLAAALRRCEGATSDAEFVCPDDRLRQAAWDEGFSVLHGEEVVGR
jgi:predicted nucleic acid-binding protein